MTAIPTTTTRTERPELEAPHGLSRRALLRRGGWLPVLDKPCPRHGAKAGAPCWAVPRTQEGVTEAVCGARVASAQH